MAIYHFSAKIISRGKGRNAVAAAAYRRAQKFFDERCNRTWNYGNKPGVVHSEISLPANSFSSFPWTNNITSEKLWNFVEKSEKRIDSQLAREIEFSLPVELNQEQSILLAREFINDQFVSQGMIADWNVHWDNPANPHVHVMLTMRELTASGFGQKVVDWNQKSLLFSWRAKWAEHANVFLRKCGIDISIDHRSYKDQGIDLIPTVHRGHATDEMKRRGKKVDRLSEESEIMATDLSRLDEIVKRIEKQYSVFGDKEIKAAISTYAKDPLVVHRLSLKLKTEPQYKLILLGVGEHGKEKYTTQRLFELENRIQKIADTLQGRYHKPLTKSFIEKRILNYEQNSELTLTDEQRNAVCHLLNPKNLTCMIGRAGSGKSFTLGAAKHLWEKKSYRVQGITLSGIAAANLQKESGISSRTIAAFKYAIQNQTIQLTSKDIVIMDEAGMTDSESMAFVLSEVDKAKAKLVLVGDPNQLQPINSGSVFRAIIERTGFAEINRIYRQREVWQQEATTHLAIGKTTDALNAYDSHHCIHFSEDPLQAKLAIISQWQNLREQNKNNKDNENNKIYEKHENYEKNKKTELSDILILTHRNIDVKELNQMIRQERIVSKEIDEGLPIWTSTDVMNFSDQDRILFTKNDKSLGVKNGQFGTITQVSQNKITVETDTGRTIQFNPIDYANFTHGYAATVHKAQGTSVKHSLVYVAGSRWDKHLAYVALSRHKESCHIFTDKRSYKNIAQLSEQLSKKSLKDSVLDYPVGFAERRGIDNESLLEKIHHKLTEKLIAFKEKIAATFRRQQIQERERHKTRDDIWLDSVMKKFVDYNVEQTNLVNLMHRSYSRQDDGIDYSVAPKENLKRIREFATEISKAPQFEKALKKIEGLHSWNFKDRNNYQTLQKNMINNDLSDEDQKYLIRALRNTARAAERARVEKLQRSQGYGRRHC